MARQTLTKQVPKGPYPTLPVAADSLDMTFTAADATNKEQFIPSGDDLVIAWNTHATTPYTITITSVLDDKNRTGDITTYSLAAGDHSMIRLKKAGWMQSDGRIYIEASNASVKWSIVQL